MELTLKVWRQKNANEKGKLVEYKLDDVSPDMSFIEMLEMLNEKIEGEGEEPVAFDCDCLEGICGACSLMINGRAHGPDTGTTTCQTHMRSFKDGQTVIIEPWKAKAFPLVKDLVVDRGAFDRVIQSGGFVSVNTGGAPDANALPISKTKADQAMDAAECIGCGACVASCKNGSAMLFVGAKVSHLSKLPQGDPERARRVSKMVEAMDKEGFGACTNQYECEAACPKEIPVRVISEMNREYLRSIILGDE